MVLADFRILSYIKNDADWLHCNSDLELDTIGSVSFENIEIPYDKFISRQTLNFEFENINNRPSDGKIEPGGRVRRFSFGDIESMVCHKEDRLVLGNNYRHMSILVRKKGDILDEMIESSNKQLLEYTAVIDRLDEQERECRSLVNKCLEHIDSAHQLYNDSVNRLKNTVNNIEKWKYDINYISDAIRDLSESTTPILSKLKQVNREYKEQIAIYTKHNLKNLTLKVLEFIPNLVNYIRSTESGQECVSDGEVTSCSHDGTDTE